MKHHKCSLRVGMLLLSSALLFSACSSDDPDPVSLPDDTEIVSEVLTLDLENLPNYAAHDYPVYYGPQALALDNTPANNPITDEGAALGRVLFYDTQLSLNNTVACASCHIQNTGFVDTETFSKGFNGGLTGAHSMRLANAKFYAGESMFWDKRAASIEEQSTQPIKDAVEMGFDESAGGLDSLIRRMEGLAYYPILFENAFGDRAITEDRMQRALAQFIRSIVSTDSKFDKGFAQAFVPGQPGAGLNADFPNFTAEENEGKRLFLTAPSPTGMGGAGCAGCHQPPTFALDAESKNNGLDENETVVFKAPSLKNVAVAGPYMHDGRLATLDEVVEHYNTGIQRGPELDRRLMVPNGNPIRLNLNDEQKRALVAFLRTLTDQTLLADQRYANPFK